MSNRTFSQSAFIFAAHCLGVRIFKRYWPNGGSYWNSLHIDPNSTKDLRSVIVEADGYSKWHIRTFVGEVVASAVIFITTPKSRLSVLKIIAVSSLTHAYAFMVHHYNRILAREALLLLPESNDQDELQSVIQPYEHGWNVRSTGSYHKVLYCYRQLGPDFSDLERARSFMTWSMERYPTPQHIFDALYTGRVRADYEQWKEIDNSNE